MSGSVCIEAFAAGPVADGTSTLSWSVRGAARIVLSGHGEVAAARQSLPVPVPATRTFVLTAYGHGFGDVDARALTVSVPEPPRLAPGVIALWGGHASAIPAGWRLCDGTDGTPDLTGRCVVGAGEDVGAGRSRDGEPHDHPVTITLTGATDPAPDHGHALAGGWRDGGEARPGGDVQAITALPGIDPAGGHAHEIRITLQRRTQEAGPPRLPSVALCFIQWRGA